MSFVSHSNSMSYKENWNMKTRKEKKKINKKSNMHVIIFGTQNMI